MNTLHPAVRAVTARIQRRSGKTRAEYLRRLDAQASAAPHRAKLSCGNLAHGFAACGAEDKARLSGATARNLAIVSAYNDMLSAHQPYARFPAVLKSAATAAGATAQFAGGTPAMCDGVTQGRAGMELSLFSRDVIAQSAAIALSHGMFDAAACLGICDKIVPGLLIGALAFGHLPVIFVPGGPMPSGLPNREKSRSRKLFAEGKIGRVEMLRVESASYHSPGTCTFYGTANSNQMFMEVMGLHLPGGTFVNPGDPLRDRLTALAAGRVLDCVGDESRALGRLVDERALVNAMVGLLATGGSTNHTIHLCAIARAGGMVLDWEDFEKLSAAVPLLARVYPNGEADVNAMRDAGGMAFLIRELAGAGLLHDDAETIMGRGLTAHHLRVPRLAADGSVAWEDVSKIESGDDSVLRKAANPFSATGGIRLLTGNLGRGVAKVSAVADSHRMIRAPVILFSGQDEFLSAFRNGDLDGRDFIATVRFQGARANGMPELHKLSPSLGVLQGRGRRVALLTDGRMSGASGDVLAVIHMHPEAAHGGGLARLRDGDIVEMDANAGVVRAEVAEAEWSKRIPATRDSDDCEWGCGRELFASMRRRTTSPEEGATTFY